VTEESNDAAEFHFSSALPVIVYTRPVGQAKVDWQEFDRGPGYFHIPGNREIGVRIKSIDDRVLKSLVEELRPVEPLRFLDLSENRNVTDAGITRLSELKQITILNLSSCTVTNAGLTELKQLTHLERLILSYCNKLNDSAIKTLESMRSLEYVDIQGCLSITKGALARVRRRNLVIYR
jgi:hypothetical protein